MKNRKEIRIKQNVFYSGKSFAFAKCVFSTVSSSMHLPSFWKSFKMFSSNTDGNESKVEYYSLTGIRKYFSFHILKKMVILQMS